MYLGNKTLCDFCNSKTAKKRHKKVEKDSAEQHQVHPESGSGDHNETTLHVEVHAKEIPEGEFKCCLPSMMRMYQPCV
jgi:hypothetical protein